MRTTIHRKLLAGLFLLFFFSGGIRAGGQVLARYAVTARAGAGIAPLAIPCDLPADLPGKGRLALFETREGTEREIPCQTEPGERQLLWILFDHDAGDREYLLRRIQESPPPSAPVTVRKSETAITVFREGKPVLTYNHAEIAPPEGVDMKFRRSAFIHPLWSPGGEILTRIQPPDHYHHYGIWNPWTKTVIDGREVDFWNLLKGEGTVRYAGCLDMVEGALFGGMKLYQEHIFFPEQGMERVALTELWDIRVWASPHPGIHMVDLTSTLNSPLPEGILLDAYRYGGGIGYRATEKWHKDNSTVLTSEGKTREEADGTSARWCITGGESATAAGKSGILFLSHPSNRMHPEPMRVWPSDANGGRGDLFFEFCPIRHQPWKLERAKNYLLRYRLVVFDGTMEPGEAEKYWQAYACDPCITCQAP